VKALGLLPGTRLGGYTVITAADLDAAVALAARCPVLEHGGAVEVGELTLVNAAPRGGAGA
jgi:hypothetical protein